MKKLHSEHFAEVPDCMSMVHQLAEQAMQTDDMLVHNQAVREWMCVDYRFTGGVAISRCTVCDARVSVPVQALAIDPLT